MVLSLRVTMTPSELEDTPPPSETAEQREARRDKEMAWMLEALNNMNHLLRNYGEHRSLTPPSSSTPPVPPPPPVHTPATVTESAEPSRNERVSFAPPRVSERILPSPPLAVGQKKTQELQQSQESSDDDLMPLKNSEISLGNFVEQVVGVSSQEASHGFWTSKVPSATQNLTQRRIAVKRSYHKVRKRRMKRDHRSQPLHLQFRVLSPRNQLYLGEDRFNFMADENHKAGTRRARFKQRFKQFQKRRSMGRYRVVIASFRSKHKSWVVAKKRDKISSHTFSFPPLNRLTVSDDDVLSQTDSILTFDKEFLKLSSLAKEVCKLSGVIAKHDDGVLSSVIAMKNDSELLLDKSVASVNSLSFEVGTEENMSSGLSQTSQVWEPGGILANGTLDSKYGYGGLASDEEKNKLWISCENLETEIMSLYHDTGWVKENQGSIRWFAQLQENVLMIFLCDKRPFDPGKANCDVGSELWLGISAVREKRIKKSTQGEDKSSQGSGSAFFFYLEDKVVPHRGSIDRLRVVLEQLSDFNLEDKVVSLPPGIVRFGMPLAFMKKKSSISGRKARLGEKKNQKQSG